MKCVRKGIQKEGESCTKNNSCTYPDCLELPKQEEDVKQLAKSAIKGFGMTGLIRNDIIDDALSIFFKKGYKAASKNLYTEEDMWKMYLLGGEDLATEEDSRAFKAHLKYLK